MSAVTWKPPLTVHPDNENTITTPNRIAGAPRPYGSAEQSTAADENRRFKAFAVAKLLLCGVRDSADAFGPLKSVAGGLYFILENFEVRLPRQYLSQCSQVPQRTKANEQAIESLGPRINALAEQLCESVPEGDFREQERRTMLER